MTVLWPFGIVLAAIVYLQIGYFLATKYDPVDGVAFVGCCLVWPLVLAGHGTLRLIVAMIAIITYPADAWQARTSARKRVAGARPESTVSPIGRIDEIDAKMHELAAEKAVLERRPDASRH